MPKINLSGHARKALVQTIADSLQSLQADGGMSTLARLGLSLFSSWLAAELARLEEKYPG